VPISGELASVFVRQIIEGIACDLHRVCLLRNDQAAKQGAHGQLFTMLMRPPLPPSPHMSRAHFDFIRGHRLPARALRRTATSTTEQAEDRRCSDAEHERLAVPEHTCLRTKKSWGPHLWVVTMCDIKHRYSGQHKTCQMSVSIENGCSQPTYRLQRQLRAAQR
jgi:hypothetical protein